MKSKYYLVAPFLIIFLFINQAIMSLEHPSGWLPDQYLELARDAIEVQDGLYGLRIELTTSSSRSLWGQEIPVTAGQTFTLSFYYNTSAHVRVRGILNWIGATATYATVWGGDGIDDAVYEQYIFSGTVPAGATGVRVRIELNAQSGFNLAGEIQYIDNVQFEAPAGTLREIYNNSFEKWQKVNWTEIVRRSASNGSTNNTYGWSVSIYGNYAAVGVQSKECVYLLKKDQGGDESWGELKIITASDGSYGDQFGQTVSLSSQFLVVGAPGHRYDVNGENPLQLAGAVYVFRSTEGGTDNWGEYKKFVPGDRQEQDQFGTTVSIWGQTFIVGCPYCDLDEDGLNFLAWAGAAYMFETPYSYVRKKFVAGDRHQNDNFGWSVSIIGNDVAIGAIQNDYDAGEQNLLSNAGAAYVFNKDQGGTNYWGQVKKLVASDRQESLMFGSSVSINGNTLVVGAPRNDYDINGENYLEDSGACYMFGEDKDGEDNWGEMMKFVPEDRHQGDYFGNSVYLGYTDFIAGARYDDYDALGENYLQNAGAAYLFSQKVQYTDTWECVGKAVSGNRTSSTVYGWAVDMTVAGDYAIVGNPYNVGTTGGVVSILKPVIQAAYIEFNAVTANSFSIFCAAGEGDRRAVFVKEGNSGTVSPMFHDTYSANSLFSFGEQVGSSGWYCVYNGTGFKNTVTGLDPVTEYRVMVCEYTGAEGSEIYFTCIAEGNPANITTGIDLSGTNIHVANGVITGTTTEMQYSLNSTNGTDGSWADCSDPNTAVSFQQGKVYVHQKNLVTNFRLVATINPAPSAPSFSINYAAERTNEIVASSIEYNFDNDFSTLNYSGPDNYLTLVPGADIYFRIKATQLTLPGAVQHLDVPSRNSAPVYTIDFINETTVETGDPSHEYSVNSNMNGAVTATGVKIILTPGVDLYLRAKATASSFSGEIQHLAVPARPVINYTVDFTTETTKENISIQDEYSLYQDMSQAKPGAGLRIALNPGENVYFRRKATASSFASDILTLVVPDRPEVPVVSLSDRNSASAVFKKSVDGTGDPVNVQDAMEYSENFGMNWNPITPLVAVNASGMKYIIVRKMATSISFSSQSTGNLDYEKPVVSIVNDEACNGPGDYVICRSNLDNGMIYLVAAGEPQSGIDDFINAIDAGKGSSAEASSPNDDIQVPVNSLIPGTYHAYATNDYDSLSDVGITVISIYGIPEVDLGPDIIKCKNTQITINPGMEFTSYSWNYNNATTQSITVTEEDDYILTVTNEQCYNSDTIRVSYNIPYQEQGICIVTIDLATGKNLVVWDNTSDKGISAYKLYRERIINVYDSIARINASNLSIFRDMVADAESQAFRYKITTIDSCGTESLLENSKYHEPIYLQYVSAEGGINLEWTNYQIEGSDIGTYLTSFIIYRGTDSTGLQEYITLGSTNKYTDKDPDALVRKYYYRVAGVLKDPCSPTGSSGKKVDSGPYSQSMSNIEDNRIEGTYYDPVHSNINPLVVYPNPFNQTTTILYPNPGNERYKFIVTDISGKKLMELNNITSGEIILERGELPAGLYLIELRGPDIYRGKVVIE